MAPRGRSAAAQPERSSRTAGVASMGGRLAPFLIAVLAWTNAALAAEAPPHHAEGGFRNPLGASMHGGLGSFFKIARLRLFSDTWQSYEPERDRVPLATPTLASNGAGTPRSPGWDTRRCSSSIGASTC